MSENSSIFRTSTPTLLDICPYMDGQMSFSELPLVQNGGTKMAEAGLDLKDLASASFGLQVLTMRELFGLTKSELADVLGVNEKTIRRWEGESGATSPRGGNTIAVNALK